MWSRPHTVGNLSPPAAEPPRRAPANVCGVGAAAADCFAKPDVTHASARQAGDAVTRNRSSSQAGVHVYECAKDHRTELDAAVEDRFGWMRQSELMCTTCARPLRRLP